jgi:hypothetical protein
MLAHSDGSDPMTRWHKGGSTTVVAEWVFQGLCGPPLCFNLTHAVGNIQTLPTTKTSQQVTFCVFWLLSLSTVVLTFFHIEACVSISCLFKASKSFLTVLGFELRALHLLGKQSIA